MCESVCVSVGVCVYVCVSVGVYVCEHRVSVGGVSLYV